MSTTASIGIERSDGSIAAVFLKWDGDRDHTGRVLADRFSDRALVEKLVLMGPVPTICEYVRRVQDPSFRCHLNCENGISFKKYRPRPKMPIWFRDREDVKQRGEEYVYIWGRDDKWYWCRYHNEFALLVSKGGAEHE